MSVCLCECVRVRGNAFWVMFWFLNVFTWRTYFR